MTDTALMPQPSPRRLTWSDGPIAFMQIEDVQDADGASGRRELVVWFNDGQPIESYRLPTPWPADWRAWNVMWNMHAALTVARKRRGAKK